VLHTHIYILYKMMSIMRSTSKGRRIFTEDNNKRGQKFDRLKNSERDFEVEEDKLIIHRRRHSDASAGPTSPPRFDVDTDPLMVLDTAGPYDLSNTNSPYSRSPWSRHMNSSSPPPRAAPPSPPHHHSHSADESNASPNALIGSLIREEGHIYSLAVAGELLYTGSDSKNIRVWKDRQEFSTFKANYGLVKTIVVGEDKVFTGHNDGKIRVWKVSTKNGGIHKRIDTIPTLKDYLKGSMNPKNFADDQRRSRKVLWSKHYDAISCLGLSDDGGFLYSASWDKTFKVWRVSDFKCLESINAHDDAVNSLVVSLDGLVFTGSADGTMKVWRRELQGKGTKHFFSQTLLKQECAVTALAVNFPEVTFLYAGSSDGIVNFWDTEKSLSHGGDLKGHKLAVLCLATAGNLVFSGSADMGICVWKRSEEAEHTCLSVLTGHTGPVKCLAVEKDPESTSTEQRWIVYSGSLDKSVKAWKVSDQAPTMANNKDDEQHNSKPTFNKAPSYSSRGKMGSRRY